MAQSFEISRRGSLGKMFAGAACLGEGGGHGISPRGVALMFESVLPLAPQAEQIIHSSPVKLLHELQSA